jgi:NAD(P)-dependent dehydrogenase (short-subunit alcohol dehydrogenase family)
MDVTDKAALVTGGRRGIGRAIAIELARNGADVAVADVDLDGAQQVADEIATLGRRALAVTVDVTDQASVDRLAETAASRFSRIDILVNNAGIIGAAGWERRARANDEDWDALFDVNVRGVARVTDAVAVYMKKARNGKIINISSGAGRQGQPEQAAYCISKAGVISLTQASALELAPYNINVNAICPGLLWTPMWKRISDRKAWLPENTEGLTPREVFDQTVATRTPLGREQQPEDIGHLATFLASDYARNITGQAINVNGGSRMD